ncbi:MAG: leucine-rich repeat domain-containing protein [Planctomycetaceae bacterium]|nr:leucine-rich repeat domain-containing protein [Planctomycetaceae bacterium]
MKTYPDSDPKKLGAFTKRREQAQLRLARQRISAAVSSKSKKLDLSNLELRELPDELFLINNLEELILNNNRLWKFPFELAEISTLKILEMSLNGLDEIPSKIGELTELRKLDFGSNELKTLPSTIGQLHQLRILGCRSNELQELPETICDLENLEFLWLRENKIEILPERIGQLTNLKDLDLRDNLMSRLPSTLGQLENLAKYAKLENEVGFGLVLDRNPLSNPIRTIVQTTAQPETTRQIIDYFRDGSIEHTDSVGTPPKTGLRFEIQPAHTMAIGIRNGILQEIERQRSSRPNTVDELENWSQKVAILEQLKSSFDTIIGVLDDRENTKNQLNAIRQTSELSSEISSELKQWIINNKVEVVDWFFRLPVAAMMIGLFNLAGASMIWATPIVLAAVGGNTIKNLIKDIVKNTKSK